MISLNTPKTAKSIQDAPALYFNGVYLFIGGLNTDIIAELNGKSYQWRKVGKLNTVRWNYGIIRVGNNVFVVGGDGYSFTILLLFVAPFYSES